MSAIGGTNIDEVIEGRERYPINVRYAREFREDLETLKRVLVPTPMGAQIPISQVAEVKLTTGPPMVRSEDGHLVGFVFVDVTRRRIADYVADAREVVAERVNLPPGYRLDWAGQFTYFERAKARIMVIIPVTLVLVFLLLYLNTRSVTETSVVLLAVPFSLIGAVWFLYLLDYNKREGEERLRTTAALEEAIVEGAAQRIRPKLMTVRSGNIDYQTTVQGVGEDFTQARDWPVAEGQFFNAEDVKRYAAVVVLGHTVTHTLFPHGDSPIGQYILLKNVPFLVLGIMTEKGASPGGDDQDDAIFVPINTGLVRLFGKNYLSSITVKVVDTVDIEATQTRIETLLKSRHKAEDFRVRNMASLLDMAMETQNTFTLLLGTVAAISLLVGGIGVMNIMLVGVVERTREIGIRMATGARTRDILLQFNIEAAVVCATGGIIGILVGGIAGLGLRVSGMAVVFSVTPAVLAFVCASTTGLLFGYLPARQAARLDPIIALASE